MKKRFVADDGTVCKTREEELEINIRIERLFLPERIAQTFQFLHQMEMVEWFRANITHKIEYHRTFQFRLKGKLKGDE